MKKFFTLFLVVSVMLGSASVFAQQTYNPAAMLNQQIEHGADSHNYFAKAPSQLFRGLHNVAFGWSNILTDLFQPPIGLGTAMAPLTGPATAITRTLSGAIDLVTFWVPGFNGFSITDGEKN